MKQRGTRGRPAAGRPKHAAPANKAAGPQAREGHVNKALVTPRGNASMQQLCIAADLPAQSNEPFDSGHAFLNVRQGKDATVYESYPNGRNYLEGSVRPDSDVVVGPDYGHAVSEYCLPVSDSQIEALNKAVQTEPTGWTPTHNCTSWAAEMFNRITGAGIDVDDEWALGAETPRELANNIEDLNAKNDPKFKREKPVKIGAKLDRFALDMKHAWRSR